MKTLLSTLVLGSKLIALLCFTNMGLVNLTHAIDVKVPCHQSETNSEFGIKDCDTCLVALDLWSSSYIVERAIEITDGLFLTKSQFHLNSTKSQNDSFLRLVYRPPPQVKYLTAFHLPQKSTVIIV